MFFQSIKPYYTKISKYICSATQIVNSELKIDIKVKQRFPCKKNHLLRFLQGKVLFVKNTFLMKRTL